MAADTYYWWLVEHPEFGEVQVTAMDRLGAVTQAARAWGQRWTKIAKDCDVTRLHRARAGEGSF